MNIKVNGKMEEIRPCSIHEFIAGKGLNPQSVVVEHNFEIVRREKWKETQLGDNDNLEILSFVGGG